MRLLSELSHASPSVATEVDGLPGPACSECFHLYRTVQLGCCAQSNPSGTPPGSSDGERGKADRDTERVKSRDGDTDSFSG